VPQDSIWFKHEDYLSPRFGITDRWMQLVFEAKDRGNVLTAEHIREMFTVYDILAALKEPKDGKILTWTDGICWKSARHNGTDCRCDAPSHSKPWSPAPSVCSLIVAFCSQHKGCIRSPSAFNCATAVKAQHAVPLSPVVHSAGQLLQVWPQRFHACSRMCISLRRHLYAGLLGS
jgi:hypothetical protein